MTKKLILAIFFVSSVITACGNDTEQLISSLQANTSIKARYTILTSERMDYSSIPRLVVRVKVPKGLSREELEKQVRLAAFTSYKEASVKLGALSVHAYDSGDINGGYSAASLNFAPNGRWEDANPKVPLNQWKGTIEFAEGYFGPIIEIIKNGTVVTLQDENKKPIFLSKKSNSWMSEDLIKNIPHGTKVTVKNSKIFSISGGDKMIRYLVNVNYKGKKYEGWVHDFELKNN